MTRTVPQYRSSAALTSLAQRIYAVHRDYTSKRAADEQRIQYTPAGRSEVRARDAKEAFTQLHPLLAEAKRAGEEAVASARQRALSALHAVAPKLDGVTAAFAIEAARQLRADAPQRARLVNIAEARALEAADAEIAALVVHVPLSLSGLTAAQRDTLRVALVPGEAAELYTAKDEARQIAEHVGTVAGLIAEHAQHWDMSADLTIATGEAKQAASIGAVEPTPSLDADAAEPPSEPPSESPADEGEHETAAAAA